MPIHYVCVGCREEVFLPDQVAGRLGACPRCRLKFVAPQPNREAIPTNYWGSVAPPASYEDGPPPPLYPLEAEEQPAARLGAKTTKLRAVGSVEDEDTVGEARLVASEASAGAEDEPTDLAVRRGTKRYRLVALEGLPDATVFSLDSGRIYLLGRDRDADVKILSGSVSRRHSRLDTASDPPCLIDLGSANGTKVNDKPVKDREPLRPGDELRVGMVLFRFEEA